MNNLLKLDHIFIWVDKDGKEMELFKKSGFTSIISGTHFQQGTSGNYLFFLNFYIELLFISNQSEAIENVDNFGCNYIERSEWKKNHSSPFGLGFKMKEFDEENIPFNYHEYSAEWMREKNLIMAKNNQNNSDPLVFLLRPKMEFPCYNTIEELLKDDKPDDFKKNHIHENGIKKLSSVNLFIKQGNQTSDILSHIDNGGISVLTSDEDLIELIFDNEIKNKEVDFRPKLPLKIKY